MTDSIHPHHTHAVPVSSHDRNKLLMLGGMRKLQSGSNAIPSFVPPPSNAARYLDTPDGTMAVPACYAIPGYTCQEWRPHPTSVKQVGMLWLVTSRRCSWNFFRHRFRNIRASLLSKPMMVGPRHRTFRRRPDVLILCRPLFLFRTLTSIDVR